MRKSILSAFLLFLVAGKLVGTPTAAYAHEARKLGQYSVEAGWGDEPAYAGLKNSVQFILHDDKNQPVADLGDTLKVEVSTGTQKISLSIVPNFEPGEFGQVGDYRAWLIPTQPGAYSFHFTGTIKGQKVDTTFTSSETTFDSLMDPADVQFPVKEPAPAAIAERIDREIPRLEGKVDSALKPVKDKASTASTVGYIGLGLGAVALILSIAGIARKRSA